MDIDLLKKKYPEGQRVKMIKSRFRDFEAMPEGTLGTVIGIDELFHTIVVSWDNGLVVDIVPGADRFSLVYGESANGKKN